MTLKVVWGITGSGDKMPETVAAMTAVSERLDVEITAALSLAGEKVLRWYKLMEQVESISKAVLVEKNANSPFIVGKLQIGLFDCFVVAPATANSVAKIAYGIADTLITNAVAQTAKTTVPIFILPVDLHEGTTVTTRPGGEKLELRIRAVDIENARRLRGMEGVTVLEDPGEIAGALRACARPRAGEP
ncbi:MAG: archaeoflavoprotein AfpA [Thermoleophilia bacterium]